MRERKRVETYIIDVFLQKVSKIPAVIEVMRPYVVDEQKAFSLITDLHSQSIIHEYESIYSLLEHNARLYDQYNFLMRLSMAIPELQKNDYFIYIREFVMTYERMMRAKFWLFNSVAKKWNRFVMIKNTTLVGYLLPGSRIMEV
jgi:hypothetical protein